MEFITDIEKNRDRIQNSINKFGFAPEHNLDWFLYYAGPKQKPVFIQWPDGSGLLTHKSESEWNTFSEPLIPQKENGKKIAEFINVALNEKKIGKINIEARTDTKTNILEALGDSFTVEQDYTLTWPIMNTERFDSALPGGHFKSLRNAVNKFYKKHLVEVSDARKTPTGELHALVERWFKTLKQKDVENILDHPYHNMIDGGFKGLKHIRAMYVDGKLAGLNGGWEMPNSDSYYAAIGIHDYSLQDLGIILYIEDLENIKKMKYKTADMGGVEEGGPLNFKDQFLPESSYKTFIFSIAKK